MIVWGGFSSGTYFDGGGRYDPVGNAWTPMSSVGAPVGREVHTAVWSGGEMIVWGGIASSGLTSSGGRYDPENDSWSPTSTLSAPTPRSEHTAIWSGTKRCAVARIMRARKTALVAAAPT